MDIFDMVEGDRISWVDDREILAESWSVVYSQVPPHKQTVNENSSKDV